jgi:triosephosphate isomerase
MRRPIIAGNWKMNKTNKAADEFVKELISLVKDAEAEVVLCVPFTDIVTVRKAVRGTNIRLGAQNLHWAESGAYTGEISAEMLKELKVEYVIIGHSERRQYFNETNDSVNKKIGAALNYKLKPIVCIGETLKEREEGLTEKVLYTQVIECLRGYKSWDFDRIVIAYEPVWAIGTGKTATSEQANEAIGFIRKTIAKKFSLKIADKVRIQYGGSMNEKNASELMAQEEIDGGLIGGASLVPEKFAKVVKY